MLMIEVLLGGAEGLGARGRLFLTFSMSRAAAESSAVMGSNAVAILAVSWGVFVWL
jgi:hypothetical protein